MKLHIEEMRDIAKTLPIGYYLGMKVPVEIEQDGGAFCDIIKGDIHIGMDLLQIAADNIDAADAASWDREKLLRCLLYHEIGHLLLTPKWTGDMACDGDLMKNMPNGLSTPDAINIFEDERLECILAGRFIDADFEAFVRLVHKKGVGSGPKGEFLKAVRLRQCAKDVSDSVDAAIKKLADVNSQTINHGSYLPYYDYRNELIELLHKVFPDPKQGQSNQQNPQNQQGQQSEGKPEQQSEKGPQKQDGQKEGQGEGEDKNKKDKGDKQNEEQGKGQSGESGDPEDEKDGQSSSEGGQSSSEGEQENAQDGEQGEGERQVGFAKPKSLGTPEGLLPAIAKQMFLRPQPEVENVLRSFASRLAKKRGTKAAGCWSALHGKIDTRRDALDKERIFRRRNDMGERINAAVNLTLWVDVSGSFRGSQTTLNQILVATHRAVGMSGGRLAANVVKMEAFAEVAEPNDWKLQCVGSNHINMTYYDAWKKTRRKDMRNIDIVVFDGEATSHCKGTGAYVNLSRWGRGCVKCNMPNGEYVERVIWNHPDCWIVSDTSNEPFFKALKKAHVTYIDDGYAERLQSEVVKILDRIL